MLKQHANFSFDTPSYVGCAKYKSRRLKVTNVDRNAEGALVTFADGSHISFPIKLPLQCSSEGGSTDRPRHGAKQTLVSQLSYYQSRVPFSVPAVSPLSCTAETHPEKIAGMRAALLIFAGVFVTSIIDWRMDKVWPKSKLRSALLVGAGIYLALTVDHLFK